MAQVITSFLGGCLSSEQRCHAVDLGGNLGIHTSYMAALGAEVDVVEPQADLAASIRRTALANCWQGRVRVHHGGITANEKQDGEIINFNGGWRLDDVRKERQRVQSMKLYAVQKLLRGRSIDLLKIDIDNSDIEEQLIVALERLVAKGGGTRVKALVIEVATRRARTGKAHKLARALSRLQRVHGYSAYRLAHHLHSMDSLEPWYSPCIAIRTIKYMLHIRPNLTPQEWTQLLKFEKDEEIGERWRSSSWAAARLKRACDGWSDRLGVARPLFGAHRRGLRGPLELGVDGSDDAGNVARGAVRRHGYYYYGGRSITRDHRLLDQRPRPLGPVRATTLLADGPS